MAYVCIAGKEEMLISVMFQQPSMFIGISYYLLKKFYLYIKMFQVRPQALVSYNNQLPY